MVEPNSEDLDMLNKEIIGEEMQDSPSINYETAQELLTQAIAYLNSMETSSDAGTDSNSQIDELIELKKNLDPRNEEAVNQVIADIQRRFGEWKNLLQK